MAVVFWPPTHRLEAEGPWRRLADLSASSGPSKGSLGSLATQQPKRPEEVRGTRLVTKVQNKVQTKVQRPPTKLALLRKSALQNEADTSPIHQNNADVDMSSAIS